MRSFEYCLLVPFLFLAVPAWPQQVISTQSSQSPPAAPQDAQAVSVITQALAVAGGIPAINAVNDYTATGSITYFQTADLNRSVTVRGNGLGQFRLDVTVPTGVRSLAIDGDVGIKTEDGKVQHAAYQAPMSPGRIVLPYLQLSPALNNPWVSLAYKGIVEIDGRLTHDIQLQRVLPTILEAIGPSSDYRTIDFFIDASTFQLVMMQDTVPEHVIRQIRYSDFRPVAGVQVPFSIGEQVSNGQPTWLIQLNQIQFNTGLQDSDFSL